MYTATGFEAFVRALSWTFIHSLWIGLIAAFLAGVTILATRKRSPLIRYNILTSLIFLFICFTTIISINEFRAAFANPSSNNILPGTNNNTVNAIPVLETYSNVINNAISFINRNANYLMIIWFSIFVFKMIRILHGILRTERLRSSNLSPVPAEWLLRAENLKHQLNIRKPILLFESYLVRIPVTLGHLRPIILFPVGAMTSMPPAQLDAVLLHEMAHIKRNDYLINILQLLVESIFFFNPCVLWISSLIRKERENCCDDLAIGKMDSRKEFLNALISFQEFAFGNVQVAQGFAGSKTMLLNRAKRIVYDYNSSLSKTEKKSLFIALAFLALLAVGSGGKDKNNSLPEVVKRLYMNNTAVKKDLPPTNRNNQVPPRINSNIVTKPIQDTKPAPVRKDTDIVITIDPNPYKRFVIRDQAGNIIKDSANMRPRPVFSRSNRTIASIIEDLKKEGLIKDEGEKFKWHLCNEKLEVNGVEQPPEILKKILTKYIDPSFEHINIYYVCCD